MSVYHYAEKLRHHIQMHFKKMSFHMHDTSNSSNTFEAQQNFFHASKNIIYIFPTSKLDIANRSYHNKYRHNGK